MSQDIDWTEYERRKARVESIGLTSSQYEDALRRIVTWLEIDASCAEVHKQRTTNLKCSSCGGELKPISGYFDPRLIDVKESDPRKYEECWECRSCLSSISHDDLERAIKDRSLIA